MKFIAATFLTLLISTPTIQRLSPLDSSVLFHRLDFAMLSSKPGTAVAFRLARGQGKKNIFVCFRGECFRALHRWQLLATDPQIPGKQNIALVDPKQGWAFRKIHLEANMWEQSHQKIAQLRLPASVVKELEERADLIPINKTIDEHLYSSLLQRPWSSQWALPIKTKVTSEFATLRIPPDGKPYSHTGVDLRAVVGTAVHATSDGIVVGTDDEVIYGNVVTIDHGYGLMSRYMHLSSFNVEIGQRVKTGDIIGLSGATGRAEAPHLHWEMRIRGRPVDPLSTRLLLARLSDLE